MAKKSLEEGLEEAQERAGAAPADENTEPKILGIQIVTTDRYVAVGDTVLLHTNTPINGQTDLLAEVTKLNVNNSTINVKVMDNQWGKFTDRDSVKNFIPQDRSDWWSFPVDEAVETDDAPVDKKAK